MTRIQSSSHVVSQSSHLPFSAPSIAAGGSKKIIIPGILAKQPSRQAWTKDHLERECAIALGQAIDNSTWSNYSSALNSYLDFEKIYGFAVEPTPDILSFYVVFMSHHVKPGSIDTYLSGICQQLEPFFPDVRKHRKSLLVTRTLKGCKRIQGLSTQRKHALTHDDLLRVLHHYHGSSLHDVLLFVTQLLVGFFALMRLGELTVPDDTSLHNPSGVSKHTSVHLNDDSFQFFLPHHKADRFFEGNIILCLKKPVRATTV